MVWTQRRREQMREVLRLAVEVRESAHWQDEPIDWIAFLVASLADSPLTPSQRERLRIIAKELNRRSALYTNSRAEDGSPVDAASSGG